MINYGYISHIKVKLLQILNKQIDFDWFSCEQHKNEIKKEIFLNTISLVLRKFCNDKNIKENVNNRKPYTKEKLKKVV